MRYHFIPLVALLVTLAAVGCRNDETPPETWKTVDMAAQPTLFEMRDGHPALADLDGLFLGQPKKKALEALHAYCKHPVRRDAGMMGGEAYFLGCRLETHETLNYVRVGFWPKIDERVATLEIKRTPVPPHAVRRAYLDILEESPKETYNPRRLQIVSNSYRLFADWDAEGREGPVHVMVGFAPDVEHP